MTDYDLHEAIDEITAEGYMLKAGSDPDAARSAFEHLQKGDHVEPVVVSKANPDVEWLLEARRTLSSNASIRDFVREARASGLDAAGSVDRLSLLINEQWQGQHVAEAFEAAQYLWDEQDQLGDGIFLISTKTGKATVRLEEKDLYKPAPVPREGGGMAQPLPRIRPDLEGAIVSWLHEKNREERVLQALTERAHQTPLLREQGDPRLLVATRAGRRHLVAELSKFDPQTLLRSTGGTSASFLQHFKLTGEEPVHNEGLDLIEGVVFSKSITGVQDQTTINLHHNRAASVQGALVQGWVREVARQLGDAAAKRFSVPEGIPQAELRKAHLGGCGFWVCPPEALKYLRQADPTASLMPVASSHLVGLLPDAGVLVVPEMFEAASLERFDRWEVTTNVSYRLWVDWTKVKLLVLSGIVHQAVPI